ncbi:MAG: hypothetical protein M1835_001840 [Candelina submexicana]|nr:MAG: hypothetical protein M1835_001840 [Candelina submexicana]
MNNNNNNNNKEDQNAGSKGTNPRRDDSPNNKEGQTSRNVSFCVQTPQEDTKTPRRTRLFKKRTHARSPKEQAANSSASSGGLLVSDNRAANNSSSSSLASTFHLADRWQNSSNDFLDEFRAFGASDPAPASATAAAVPHNLPGAPPSSIPYGLPVRASARQSSRRGQRVTPRASAARSRARNQRTPRNPPASRAASSTASLAPPPPPPPPMAPPNLYRNATTQTNAATQDASAQTEDSTTANNDALESAFSALLGEGPLSSGIFAGIEQPSGTPAADLPRHRAVSPPFGPQYYDHPASNVGEALPPPERAYVGDLPTLFPPQQYPYPNQPLPGVATGGFWSSYQPITNPYHPDYVAPPPPLQQQQQQFPTLQQMVANPNPPPLPRQRRGAGSRHGAEMRHDPLRRAEPSFRRADRSLQQQQQGPTTRPGGRSTNLLPSPPTPTPTPTLNPIFERPQEPKPKRSRRRGDEIDKIYFCEQEGCGKAYGQLHHLNEHIRKCGHGKEKESVDFREAREALNLREKARRETRGEEERKKKKEEEAGKDGGDGDDDDDDDENEEEERDM